MISDLLDHLAISTLNSALDVLSRGENLWIVVALASEDDYEFQQFSEDSPEECLEAACTYVQSAASHVQAYAICYEGFAEMESADESGDMVSIESDALIVDFGERGEPESYSLITPYRSAHSPQGFEVLAETACVQEDMQLL